MTVPNVKNLLLKSASVMATVLVQTYTKGFCAAKVSNLFFFIQKGLVMAGLGSKIYF